MAAPHSTKSPAARSASRQQAGAFRAYQVKSRGVSILADVELPRDTTIVVIPKNATADAELKRSGAFTPVRGNHLRTSFEFPTTGQGAQKARGRAINTGAFEPDARARAILRGVAYAQDDLKEAGGAYDVEQVRALLHGVTRQALDKRVADGTLLTVPGPSGRRRFPTLQFNDDGSVVGGLKEVQAALNYVSSWSVLNFLINANDLLAGERPIDALRRGEIDLAVRAAESVGVQGA